MIKHFFLADFMSMIACRLSFPSSIIIVFLFFASIDSLAQSCDCPPAATCNVCDGGFTRFTLKYNSVLPLPGLVTAFDQGGQIFSGWINPTMTFSFSGSVLNEKFQGSNVYIYVDGILNTSIGTNCGDAYPGVTKGSFTITSINSKTGGTVCCQPGTHDSTFPVISGCPVIAPVTTSSTSCTATVTWTAPTVSDNCTVATWTSTHNPPATFPIGTTPVTYTAIDTYGNQAKCTFNVTVSDATAPSLTGCPINITVTANASCQAQVTWTPPTATDNCSATLTSTHQPNTLFPIGTSAVTYTATDPSGNKSSCTFNVVVQDKTPPVFVNCPTDITATANSSCVAMVNWQGPTITDNCTLPIPTSTHTSGSNFPFGETVVTYTAVDVGGNRTTCSFKVLVKNPTAPSIEGCPGTITVNATTAERDFATVTWEEPSATVKCGEVSSTSSHAPGDKFPVGKTPVTYTFTDDAGDFSTCTFDVIVLEPDVLFGISKAVTPDGDGINDVWTLTNIEQFKNNTVVIIDRWGNKIFEATGYNNEGIVWRGTNKDGTIVPTGTYFYTIEVKDQGKVVLKKGFIEVIQ